MRPCVFIQANHRQIAGAIVAEHALKRNSKHGDEFDVRIIHHKDYPFFLEKEGKPYLRDGVHRKWHNNDLQSFTLTRFMPPELMGYKGRAVCIDPDVFALGDVWELLPRDWRARQSWRPGRNRGSRKKRASWPRRCCCSIAPS